MNTGANGRISLANKNTIPPNEYVKFKFMVNVNKNNALVSIIVPVHNCEKTIKTTIDSILRQTYPTFEVIVVDDFSTDKSEVIVKSFNDERIVYLKNDKQLGAAYSRNRAIKLAKGEYIAFLDGDDLWGETKLEEQLSFMKENNYSFSCTDYDVIDENGVSTGVYITGPLSMDHKTFIKTDYVGCLTIMYKRELYPDLEIPDSIKKRNDYALWIKLSEKANCYRLKKVLASYRKVGGSLSSGNKIKLLSYHKDMFSKLYGYGKLKSSLYALRNGIYYFYRRLRYAKKV